MATTITAADYDELLTATVIEHGQKLADNVTKTQATLDLLTDGKSPLSGSSVTEPLLSGENKSTESTNASGEFSGDVDSDLISSALYTVGRPVVTHTRLPWATIEGNQGKNAVFNLVQTHITGALAAQKKELARKMWVPKSATGDFLSIPEIVNDRTAIGGIDPAEHEFWQSKVFYNTEMPILKAIRFVANRIAQDALESPDTLILGLEAFEELEDAVLANGGRYDFSGSNETAQTRFRQYKVGELLCRLDVSAPSKAIFFMRKETVKLRPIGPNWLRFLEKRQAMSKTAGNVVLDWVTPVATYALLTCNERRANGVLYREADTRPPLEG